VKGEIGMRKSEIKRGEDEAVEVESGEEKGQTAKISPFGGFLFDKGDAAGLRSWISGTECLRGI
jgi:hypothetical protein